MNKLIIFLMTIMFLISPAGSVITELLTASDNLAYGAEKASQPKVKFAKKKFKFGKVKKGKIISHDFTIFNEGDGVLKIVDLIPAWRACTSASASSAEILPGKSGTVTVTVDTNSDKVKPGKALKSVEVWTNDPKKKMTILMLKGIIEPPEWDFD